MAKHLTYTITFPKPITAAWADLMSPAWQEGKMAFAGTKDEVATVTPNADGTARVVLDRKNPVVGVPNAVKKLTGDWQHVVETLTWGPAQADGTRSAKIEVDFKGLPLSMHGTLTLAPAGDVTNLTLDCEYKSGVPLVGGKLESTAADESRKSMDSEARFSGQSAG